MPGSRQQIFLLYALREGGHAPRLRSRPERASDMHPQAKSKKSLLSCCSRARSNEPFATRTDGQQTHKSIPVTKIPGKIFTVQGGIPDLTLQGLSKFNAMPAATGRSRQYQRWSTWIDLWLGFQVHWVHIKLGVSESSLVGTLNGLKCRKPSRKVHFVLVSFGGEYSFKKLFYARRLLNLLKDKPHLLKLPPCDPRSRTAASFFSDRWINGYWSLS
jgi:hypothetical protein